MFTPRGSTDPRSARSSPPTETSLELPSPKPLTRRTNMSYDKPIHRIAIVGTGVIGASWAAQYLARGFDVITTDPAPNAEVNLRKYVDEAWPDLTNIGLSGGAARDRLTFTTKDRKSTRLNSSH